MQPSSWLPNGTNCTYTRKHGLLNLLHANAIINFLFIYSPTLLFYITPSYAKPRKDHSWRQRNDNKLPSRPSEFVTKLTISKSLCWNSKQILFLRQRTCQTSRTPLRLLTTVQITAFAVATSEESWVRAEEGRTETLFCQYTKKTKGVNANKEGKVGWLQQCHHHTLSLLIPWIILTP